MAAFEQNFTLETSADGLTLTFSDTSTYDISDEAYAVTDFSRQLVLIDSAGGAIQTITLGATALTALISVTSDLWVNATLISTGINGIPSYTRNKLFPFSQITKNLYRQALSEACDCGCTNKQIENALVKADIFFRGAELTAPTGDGVTWQTDIDAAYTYLNAVS